MGGDSLQIFKVPQSIVDIMRRIFINQDQITGDKVTIIGREARHLSLVLRAKPGEKIELFDGTGWVYLAKISDIKKSAIRAAIISCQETIETPPFLHLGLGLLKGKKMDFIIQKANELGVHSIFPLSTQNCAVPPPTASQHKRWQRIILESCKQCGRARPLICHPHASFDDFIRQNQQFDTKIVLWENEKDESLKHLYKRPPPNSTLLLIGPEGGFQDKEIELTGKYNFIATTLGSKILRAETAAITAISISQFLLGNLERHDDMTI
jgi:16S rRNA (uracil1498-N3)-methyltransferase